MRFLAVLLSLGSFAAAAEVDFRRDVQPILSNHCYACHGPDEADRAAGVRLDTADGVAEIVDEITWRIDETDPDVVMPPPETHKPLSDDQKQTLKDWIDAGAPVEGHWAFEPPRTAKLAADVPEGVKGLSDVIDHFVDAEIDARGLPVSSPADPRSLLRRVTLDLTGLPPSREAIDAMGDAGPGWYGRRVDELLDSPEFGRHFARHWLDLVRYADTHGLHLDNRREMWAYRDWVVGALNDNLPIDDFLSWQVAGDLIAEELPEDQQRDALIASGYGRLNVSTNEGGSIADEVFARNCTDRTDAFGTVFLGLTTQCATCHDHKFDPITQKDYYSLLAFFNSLDGYPLDNNDRDPAPSIRVPTDAQSAEEATWEEELATAEAEWSGPMPDVDRAMADWSTDRTYVRGEGDPPTFTIDGQTIEPEASWPVGDGETWHHLPGLAGIDAPVDAPEGYRFADPMDLPTENRITVHPPWIVGPIEYESPDAANYRHPIEYWRAPDTDKPVVFIGEPRRWRRFDEYRPLSTYRRDAVDDRPSLTVVYHRIDSPTDAEVTLWVGGDDGVVASINNDKVVDENRRRTSMGVENTARVKLRKGVNHLYLRWLDHGGRRRAMHALDSPWIVHERTGDAETDRRVFRRLVTDHPDAVAAMIRRDAAVTKLREVRDSMATTLVWKERDDKREAYIFRRGAYGDRGDTVTRNTPSFLPPLPEDAPKDRRTLAAWLVDDNHPLTARVFVNRVWQIVFGRGLVATSEDFGAQGEPPSHPELLDHLAVEFVRSGWDLKRLVRAMMMTDAYRRDSAADGVAHRMDPGNRYLARGTRYRLDAEVLRDQALFVSGLLRPCEGGPSVKPPQPDGLWEAVAFTSSNTAKFTPDEGDKVYRRSLYTFWKRTSAPPQMATLDAPNRESCTARRERTNTPLQALLLMNEGQFVQAATGLADRAAATSDDPAERLRWMFETVTARPPGDAEFDALATLVDDAAGYYESHPSLSADAGGDPDRSAWILVATTILNMDEVVSK